MTYVNLLDLEPLARAKLPEPIFDFTAGIPVKAQGSAIAAYAASLLDPSLT